MSDYATATCWIPQCIAFCGNFVFTGSDPYLIAGYDKKHVALSPTAAEAVTTRVEVDLSGNGPVVPVPRVRGRAGPTEHVFPDAFGAYWVRVVSEKDAMATAVFSYE